MKKNLHINLAAVWRKSYGMLCGMKSLPVILLLFFLSTFAFQSCEREPLLHLHDGGDMDLNLPIVELSLDVYWDYEIIYGVQYDWRSEWYYGWDEEDKEIFGELEYTEPTVFNLRRYFTGQEPYAAHTSVLEDMVYGNSFRGTYDWGYWDLLIWNDIQTIDGVQSLIFDESTSLDYVTAYTSQTMYSARYNAPRYNRSFYAPEPLFSAYSQAIEINRNLDGFTFDEVNNVWVKSLDMQLLPITYIYLPQIILHHNNGRVSGVDGSGNLSGMARSVNVNTGLAGSDAVTVNYNVRLKNGCDMNGENVDIIGGRMLTFGMCNLNPNKIGTRTEGGNQVNDNLRHYIDVTMQFSTGMDSTFVFDVTDQVRQRYKGGVLTVELDMDTVPIPSRSGGSGFDAVVEDYDSVTYEFPMAKHKTIKRKK